MAKSDVWDTLKTPKFYKICVFEGCDDSRMPKKYFGGVWNIFEKILNFFHFFTTPWPFCARGLNFLGQK